MMMILMLSEILYLISKNYCMNPWILRIFRNQMKTVLWPQVLVPFPLSWVKGYVTNLHNDVQTKSSYWILICDWSRESHLPSWWLETRSLTRVDIIINNIREWLRDINNVMDTITANLRHGDLQSQHWNNLIPFINPELVSDIHYSDFLKRNLY